MDLDALEPMTVHALTAAGEELVAHLRRLGDEGAVATNEAACAGAGRQTGAEGGSSNR